MKKIYCSSRKRTPWDEKANPNSIEKFIMDNYHNNYFLKHNKLIETNEINLINSIDVKECRICGYFDIRKNGKTSNGVQRYFCNFCKQSFTPLKNTIFEGHKISITEWIEFCLNIINYGSISISSKNNKNSITTSRYWLQKLFLILRDYQSSIMLYGKVYLDETFYTVIYSDIDTVDNKKLRGLSHNKYCIGVACDARNVIAFIEGESKTSTNKTKKIFIDRIEKYSTLVHDKEKAHNILIKELNLKSIAYNFKELKNIPDKDNPLYKINHQCFLLKTFLNAHSGFDREYLQDYLNLFCFIQNAPNDKLEKIEYVIRKAFEIKVTLKYRNFYDKKIRKP